MRTDSPIPYYLPAKRVAQRYDQTIRTIDRWTEDPRKAFPQPVYLGRMRFWRVADLEAWEAAQAERSAAVLPKASHVVTITPAEGGFEVSVYWRDTLTESLMADSFPEARRLAARLLSEGATGFVEGAA